MHVGEYTLRCNAVLCALRKKGRDDSADYVSTSRVQRRKGQRFAASALNAGSNASGACLHSGTTVAAAVNKEVWVTGCTSRNAVQAIRKADRQRRTPRKDALCRRASARTGGSRRCVSATENNAGVLHLAEADCIRRGVGHATATCARSFFSFVVYYAVIAAALNSIVCNISATAAIILQEWPPR